MRRKTTAASYNTRGTLQTGSSIHGCLNRHRNREWQSSQRIELRTLQRPHRTLRWYSSRCVASASGGARGLRERQARVGMARECCCGTPSSAIRSRQPLLTRSLAGSLTPHRRLEPPPGDFSEVPLHRARGAAPDQGVGLDGRAHAARVQAVHVLRPPCAERVQALPAVPGRPHAPSLPGNALISKPGASRDESTWEGSKTPCALWILVAARARTRAYRVCVGKLCEHMGPLSK